MNECFFFPAKQPSMVLLW